MLGSFVAFAKDVAKIRLRSDDDITDRLNHRVSVAILLIFTIAVLAKQVVGDVITCWTPAHFAGSHHKFAASICWVNNTYRLPFDDRIPDAGHDETYIVYYQWVPLILLFQALFFYLPRLVWQNFNYRSGIDIGDLMAATANISSAGTADTREKIIKYMTGQFAMYFKTRVRKSKKGIMARGREIVEKFLCFMWGRRFGNFLVMLYMFVKILYLMNVIGQLFILNHFLGMKFHSYGIDVMRYWFYGKNWVPSPYFPRVTICDFQIRPHIYNVQRYSLQCVLPINLFNEKIFLFIWFWLVIVLCALITSLITWIARLRMDQERFIADHIKGKYEGPGHTERVGRFVRKYLKIDGVLVIRLVGHNSNALVVVDLVEALWRDYNEKGIDRFFRNPGAGGVDALGDASTPTLEKETLA